MLLLHTAVVGVAVAVVGDLLTLCRLYDSYCGEFLWESNEHDGVGLHFWATPKSPGCCGLYGSNGMWIIRSHHYAHFLARGLFPVKTNADEASFLDIG